MQRTIKRKSRSAIYKCFCHSLLTVTQQILYVGNEGIPFTGEFWHGRFPHHVYLACAVCLEDCPLSHILFWALSEPWTWWSVLALDKKVLCLIYIHSLGCARHKEYLKEKDSCSMSSSIPQGLFPVGEIPQVWLSLTFSSHISCSVSGNLNSTAEAKVYSRTWSFYGAIKHNIQSDF